MQTERQGLEDWNPTQLGGDTSNIKKQVSCTCLSIYSEVSGICFEQSLKIFVFFKKEFKKTRRNMIK
jgi:hypothetical protein